MINKPKYKITPRNKYSKSNNQYFGMSVWQIVWSCMIVLILGMITGFIIIVVKG